MRARLQDHVKMVAENLMEVNVMTDGNSKESTPENSL